jgi:hypothetical protein
MAVSEAIEETEGRGRPHRRRVAVVIAASLGLVAAAERDIQRRPADEVRGSKLLWRVLSLNALGAAGYFRWGRRTNES